MVGTPAFKAYSWRAVIRTLGPVHIVCHPCKRYRPVPASAFDRDSRRTGFSCSKGGAIAAQTFDDPAQWPGFVEAD
jgi:hypothetical protein